MNMDLQILNKILANSIEKHLIEIRHYNQVRIIPGIQNCLIHCAHRINSTNHTITSIDAEKAFGKIQFVTETLNNLGVERNFLNVIKSIYENPIANTILNIKSLNAFL